MGSRGSSWSCVLWSRGYISALWWREELIWSTYCSLLSLRSAPLSLALHVRWVYGHWTLLEIPYLSWDTEIRRCLWRGHGKCSEDKTCVTGVSCWYGRSWTPLPALQEEGTVVHVWQTVQPKGPRLTYISMLRTVGEKRVTWSARSNVSGLNIPGRGFFHLWILFHNTYG